MNPHIAQGQTVGAFSSITGLLECMRPAQWIKNGFVLSALLFSSHLTDLPYVFNAMAAFMAFCLAASGVYLWNDSLDWRMDLVHPDKRNRPIPSGRLSVGVAASFGLVLLACSLAVSFGLNRQTGLILVTYVVVNVLYSSWLKHAAILDLMCIALGFVLRVMAGASAIGIEASHWLLMCTFLLALFLGVSKRRQEIMTLSEDSSKHRRVLDQYRLPWIDQASTLLGASTLVAYALYTVAPETQARFRTDHLLYTLPFVVFGLLRYLHLVHASTCTGNPSSALLTDRPLLTCVVSWAASCTAIIYL
jgi:4-hydroxybenzoate polyprenyltransferase